MREATESEIKNWNKLILQNPDGGDVLQGLEWAHFKGRYGWKPKFFMYEIGKKNVAVMFLTRTAPGFGELWYSPKGPGVANIEQLLELAKATKTAKLETPFLIKFDPEIIENDEAKKQLKSAPVGLKKAPLDVHISRATIKVDLKPSLDEIIKSFKQKTRYNVRLSERKGVKVEVVEPTKKNFDVMYDLILQTQERAGFIARSKEYCSEYWGKQIKAGCAQLFFASYNGEVLAGAFVTMLGKKAWYKDGGSQRNHNELMAPYLLQWKIMEWLKQRGYESYDFVGIPPEHRRLEGDPMYGLYKFKQGFSNQVEQFIGTWDLPLDETKYKIWNKIGERLLLKYHNKVKKTLWY